LRTQTGGLSGGGAYRGYAEETELVTLQEVSIMPQLSDIEDDTPFAIFMNLKRIQHGNRKGIEIKKFDQTTESMRYGEFFMWFCMRDGFLVTRHEEK
jgi:hypothetical protein